MSIIELSCNIDEMEEFEPLPDGLYPAQVVDLEVRYTEKMPQGYIYMQLKVAVADFPADYDPGNAPEGLTLVYARTSLPDPANRRTVRPFKKVLEAFDLPANTSSIDPNEWIGKDVQVLLRRQEYQGEFINNVEALQKLPKI
jgi:hypothetical protein